MAIRLYGRRPKLQRHALIPTVTSVTSDLSRAFLFKQPTIGISGASSGTSTLNGAATKVIKCAVSLTGNNSAVVNTVRVQIPTGALTGANTAIARPYYLLRGALTGTNSTGSAVPRLTTRGTGSLVGSSALTSTGQRVALPTGGLTGSSTASITASAYIFRGSVIGSSAATAALWRITSGTGTLAGAEFDESAVIRQRVAAGELEGANTSSGELFSNANVALANAAANGSSTANATGSRDRRSAAVATGTSVATGTLVLVDKAFVNAIAAASGRSAILAAPWRTSRVAGNLPNGSGTSASAIRVAIVACELDGAGVTWVTPFYLAVGRTSGLSGGAGRSFRVRWVVGTARSEADVKGNARHLLPVRGSLTGTSIAICDSSDSTAGILAGANATDAIAVGAFAASAATEGVAYISGAVIRQRVSEGTIAGSNAATLEPTLPVAGLVTGSTATDAKALTTGWVSGTVAGSNAIRGALFSALADTNLAAGYNELVADLKLFQGIRGYAPGSSTTKGQLVAGEQVITGRTRSNSITTGNLGFDRMATGHASGVSITVAIANVNVVLATAESSDNAGAITADACYWRLAEALIDEDANNAAAEALCILDGWVATVTDTAVVNGNPHARESIRGQAVSFSQATARVAPNVRLANGGLIGTASAFSTVPPIVAEGDHLNGITDLRGYLAGTMEGRVHGWSVSLLTGRAMRTKPISGRFAGWTGVTGTGALLSDKQAA